MLGQVCMQVTSAAGAWVCAVEPRCGRREDAALQGICRDGLALLPHEDDGFEV